MKKLSDASVTWLNREALSTVLADPNLPSEESLKSHLINSCAYVVSGTGAADEYGWADRYGGAAVGTNGGSGRSVLLNGYSVKGIGRTPLIGSDAPAAHSSGGAYLEEAIRETIFSQFLQRTFPHGAAPILAIIDTGLDQVWPLENGKTKTERRVLIVRPSSLRPAHFERQYRYRPAGFDGKRADIRRVTHNFTIFSQLFGASGLRDRLRNCYVKWAEQIAFATVHNVALGPSPSNVTLDGQILDFGAVSTLPVAANYVISPGSSIIWDFEVLLNSAESVAQSASEFDPQAFQAFGAELEEEAIQSYERRLITEILTVVGLANHHRAIAGNDVAREDILKAFFAYRRFVTRLRIDLVSNQYETAFPRVPELHRIWSKDRAPCLSALHDCLQRHVPQANCATIETGFKPWSVTREHLRGEIGEFVAGGGDVVDLQETISRYGRRFN